MPELVVPQPGELGILETIRSAWATETLLHLYVNDWSPTEADTLASYTEATFPGYASQVIAWPNPPFVNFVGKAEIDEPAVHTFTRTVTGAAQTCYGYFVTDITGLELLFAQRSSSPPVVELAGDFAAVLLRFTLASEFSG